MRGKLFYKRELSDTYLVLSEARSELIENFTGQMILKGNIKGIAECTLQLLDGNTEIRYRLSSLSTLEQCFAVKEIDFATLSDIIRQILKLLEDMEENLADSNGICFEPEYLYMDTLTGRLAFLYDFTAFHDSSGITDLSEFCLERIDNKEVAAVDLAYYFYEHTRGTNFSLKEVEAYLDQKAAEKASANKAEPPSGNISPIYRQDAVPQMPSNDNGCSEKNSSYNPGNIYNADKYCATNKNPCENITDYDTNAFGVINNNLYGDTPAGACQKRGSGLGVFSENTNPPKANPYAMDTALLSDDLLLTKDASSDNNKKTKTKTIPLIPTGIICLCLSAASFAGYIIAGLYYSFSPEIELFWGVGGAALAIAGIVMITLKKRADKIAEHALDDTMDNVDLSYLEEKGSYSISGTVAKDEEAIWENLVTNQEQPSIPFNPYFGNAHINNGCSQPNTSNPYYGGARSDNAGHSNTNNYSENLQPVTQNSPGKTVYVGNVESTNDHCLIGRHRGRDREYPISSYPWIIGKDRSRVNMEVKESSVSRIHAKLTKEGSDIFLEDLASTNGTTINDLPISPHEKIRIRPGDLIRFATAEFAFE